MMLYEAVQYQRSETYHEAIAPLKMTANKTKVHRTKSANNVSRFVDHQQQQRTNDFARRGSFVVGQKLRESKWFTHDELRVFCAVVENGFIVQQKTDNSIEFGVAIWAVGQEKSKNPDFLRIYSLTPHKENYKVLQYQLLVFWPEGTKLRIYNHCDENETPHSEDQIKNQISYAENTKQKWHNTENFAHWCRYGPIFMNQRISKILKGIGSALSAVLLLSGKGLLARDDSEGKWSHGISSGFVMIKKRIRRITNNQ